MRVAVVVKRSAYRLHVEEGSDARVKRLLAKGDPTVSRMRGAHDDHVATTGEVLEALGHLGAKVTLREGSRSKLGGRFDLVVTVGGDGTLLAASHQIGPDSAILGVNSSPGNSVGFFCAAKKGSVLPTLRSALEGSLARATLTRMRVEMNGHVLHNRVLNEALICHACPAATSRYILTTRDPRGRTREEEQKSSGLWIGPPAGSTAAQASAGGKVLPLLARTLQYVVREPYTPAGVPLQLRVGRVDAGGEIVVRSKMREAEIFLDGHHVLFSATLGDVIRLRTSDEPLTVLGLSARRSRRPKSG
ncbi:MAG: NAD(+)/NADH kinase [Polyangiaceae bacterium]